jgi:hypothetical protein
LATARFIVLWWLALFGWWVVLVGTNSGIELVAAGSAALLGTVLGLGLRRHRLLHFGFETSLLVQAATVPWKVVRELGVVVWALVLQLAGRRRVQSAYRAIPFRGDGAGFAEIAGALAPNTLPVGVDREHHVMVRHELDPRRASDRP